jgi:hypothetical protein
MKQVTTILIVFLFSNLLCAQNPEIIFQNTLGGDDWDIVRHTIHTSDGGYLFVGVSESNAFFDKSEDEYGEDDAWIVKIDSNGQLEWENTIGGSVGNEVTEAVIKAHEKVYEKVVDEVKKETSNNN